jgi:hypothetical protein
MRGAGLRGEACTSNPHREKGMKGGKIAKRRKSIKCPDFKNRRWVEVISKPNNNDSDELGQAAAIALSPTYFINKHFFNVRRIK